MADRPQDITDKLSKDVGVSISDINANLAGFQSKVFDSRLPSGGYHEVISKPVTQVRTSEVVFEGRGLQEPNVGGRTPQTGGTIEVVTGAVNGVPATLNVLTDGSGWVDVS